MTSSISSSAFFSPDYATARQRFRVAARKLGGQLLTYEIGEDPNLTIDVAILGDAKAQRAVVVSCGLHGIEGFFGSATQLAQMKAWIDGGCVSHKRIVFVHGINPFGFANLRRWNEDNVDLNRNFLKEGEYRGASDAYRQLNSLLNPPTPPSRWEPFLLKAIWAIMKQGMPAIKQAVASGQYEFDKGLFFGGKAPCESTKIVQENFRDWIGVAGHVVHLDLHTGLGSSGHCKLLLSSPTIDPWYTETFGAERLEASSSGDGTAYDSSGALGDWLCDHLSDISYRFALAEFGTYGPIRVLSALRAETREHFYSDCLDRSQVKAELLECFCPADEEWRKAVLTQADIVIAQALNAGA